MALAATRMARSGGPPRNSRRSVQTILRDRFSDAQPPARGRDGHLPVTPLVGLLNPRPAPLPVVLRWLDLGGRQAPRDRGRHSGTELRRRSRPRPRARQAQVLLIQSDGPHFAFPVGLVGSPDVRARSPQESRLPDDRLEERSYRRISASDCRIGGLVCRVRPIGRSASS